jgi:hypothetical protein
MPRVFGYTISDKNLNSVIERFVPPSDLYYLADDEIVEALLSGGVPVYTRREFSESYPGFSLEYGDVYHIWQVSLAEQAWVTLVPAEHLGGFDPALLERLLAFQVRCGRGHVYDGDWFSEWERPVSTTVTVDGRWFYLLTATDWAQYSLEIRQEWVLKWLRNRLQGDVHYPVREAEKRHPRVPFALIIEYAGTLAGVSGPNCFAATIAMVVGGIGPHHYPQSRRLIAEWLHPEPFFRLLSRQGYAHVKSLRHVSEFSLMQPSDVLVWFSKDGVPTHAAFAVTNALIFHKSAQGWDHPWEVVPVGDVWYNGCLLSGGHIALYRPV